MYKFNVLSILILGLWIMQNGFDFLVMTQNIS